MLIALIGSIGLASYNNIAVTAALPDVGEDLGRVALLPWVITVELLSGAIAVLVVGPIIDGTGARRAFRFTIVGFGVSSFFCAIAPTMELLVAARLLQGFGSGALIGTAITSVGLAFDDRLRPRVFAAVSSVWGLMGISGPAVAASLVSVFDWRAVFWVNLPVTLVAAALGWSKLPSKAMARSESLDRRGLFLMSAVTVALLLSASYAEWWSLGLLAAGALLLFFYVRHARRYPTPIVRLGHFTGARWRLLHVTSAMGVAGGTGAAVFLPLYFRGARGASPAAAAFTVLWLIIGWSSSAWVASRLQDHLRAQVVVLMGASVLALANFGTAGVLLLDAPAPFVFAGFLLIGAGVGAMMTSGISLLQRRADDHEMGRISSAHQFLRSLGFAYGAAIAGLVLLAVFEWHVGDVEALRGLLGANHAELGAESVSALKSAYTWSVFASACITVLPLPAAIALVRSRE